MISQTQENKVFLEKYTREAVDELKKKMRRLNKNENNLRGEVNGRLVDSHWMYKLNPIFFDEGRRAYEFLIELDLKDPSLGIYYGVKGLTKDNQINHDDSIKIFNEHFKTLKAKLCTVLNNTFPDIDFHNRFLITDNANDKTFWPFWIRLYENEDIEKVGKRATKIIRKIYDEFLKNPSNPYFQKEMPKPKENPEPITAFTKEAYEDLEEQLDFEGYGEENKKLFDNFIEWGKNMRKFSLDPDYERAYKLESGVTQRNLIELLGSIWSFFTKEKRLKKGSIPWKYIVRVFIKNDGSPLTIDNMKNDFSKNIKDNLPENKNDKKIIKAGKNVKIEFEPSFWDLFEK